MNCSESSFFKRCLQSQGEAHNIVSELCWAAIQIYFTGGNAVGLLSRDAQAFAVGLLAKANAPRVTTF